MVAWSTNCSFGGVGFSTTQDKGPGILEQLDNALQFAVTSSPGGDNHWVQVAGRQPIQWSRQITVPSENWTSLEAKLGQQATLTVHGRSYTATLVGLTAIGHRTGLIAQATALWIV